ncbi:retrovirus-related Pol polyprotein from transposon 297 [Trichonephila clavipes]|nr:retrovirus-related Pol polyprotein from transposon 297 [Trichonephila clavipes]
MDSNLIRLDLKTVLPTFIPDKDDISLFLTMFERQMKLLNVPADFWVSHLIGVLPSDIGRNTGNPEFRKSHSFKVEKNVSGNHNSAFANPSYMPARNTNTGFHPPISCYGCGNPGFIKSKCPKCSSQKESASVNAIHMFTCLTSTVALLDIEVYEATGTVCADTEASHNTVDETETNDLHLREEEGQALNVEERNDLMVLLNESKDVFRLGGEPTPFVKHFINTGDHPPVSIAPYRLSPNRKEHLRKEIDNLLAHNIIEECESLYAASVVLVPKSNGTVRLCIDYRKLNAITIPDKYPLPLMDVLLHDAKSTAFMSTLDLKSGYHQVEVNPADQDKTAFVCPFGTFRYKRMPFGLRNAAATFQRLMDQFRNGLPNQLVKEKYCLKWSEIEQQAFQTLKQCLKTPPILRQVDPKKPFIIRTDASSYALGAVLLQGESPTNEQPVEYASRLLSSAEKITRQQSEKPWL